MRKQLFLFALLLATPLCLSAQSFHDQPARETPEWFRKGVTYQVMPRCMSEEGTLKGAEAHLERLLDLGVNTVYLLPVNVADTDMDRAYWSPRQIKSGFDDPRNPYRAGDYFHVDPEYGTDQDLKDFINHAHRIGQKVLLDLVFLHCGPGAGVVREHPEYFQHNEDGSVKNGPWRFPIFDFSRQETREFFKGIMLYYVRDFGADGFRLDVADGIPLDFWEEARKALDEFRPGIVLVAEGRKPENTLYAFDANYNWPVCLDAVNVLLRNSVVAPDKCDASLIRKAHEEYFARCPKGTLLWNFYDNHDRSTDCMHNRFEKIRGYERCTLGQAFDFALDGVPFLFSGEEVCYDKRVSLFGHKDCWIDWKAYLDTPHAVERKANIKAWVAMRKNYSALTDGETIWIDNDQPKAVVSFKRHDGVSEDVLFIGNFSGKLVRVTLADGTKCMLKPWGFVFGPRSKVLNEAGKARETPDWFREGVSYQIIPRTMSEQGTLKGAEAELERLRSIGINTVYLLPVNEADADMDQSKWAPWQVKSGFNEPRNPYRAADYFHVDPEYGTDRDLKDFVEHAHQLGMHVILDLVFAHCGPTARVMKQHPEYFQYNPDGTMKLTRWNFPVFDFGRQDTRAYMRSIMYYYIADYNVDGFRLDVADQIPLDFWEEARTVVDVMNPDFVMVAEGRNPGNTLYAFNADYGWPVCDSVRKLMKLSVQKPEECDASTIRAAHEKFTDTYPKGTLLWNMLDNHDIATKAAPEDRHERLWGYERCTLAMAYTFAVDGVPFLFNGEEVCYDKYVSFYRHKDHWINWKEETVKPRAAERSANIKAWSAMRKTYSALTRGETFWIDNDQPKSVISFKRHDGVSQDVIFVGNFSDKKVRVKLADGTKYKLEPWGFVFEPLAF